MPRGLGYGELRSRGWIRVGLVLLALPSAVIAAWSLISPRGFYDNFPGAGRHWVSALPPYNEHLLRDFGAANVTIALVIAAGVWMLTVRQPRRREPQSAPLFQR